MSPAATTTRRHPGGPRKKPKRPAARRRSGRRRRSRRLRRLGPELWWPAVLIVLVLVVGLAWKADADAPLDTAARCTLAGTTLTEEQVGNAGIIAQVGRDRGVPEQAVVIALATAMQESSLRNLDHGDRDSLGLFQQRPSQGWGTPEQVQDPVYAAGIFYDRLLEVPEWQTMRVTAAAQRVQRSAYPELYQQHAALAAELSTVLASGEPRCV